MAEGSKKQFMQQSSPAGRQKGESRQEAAPEEIHFTHRAYPVNEYYHVHLPGSAISDMQRQQVVPSRTSDEGQNAPGGKRAPGRKK